MTDEEMAGMFPYTPTERLSPLLRYIPEGDARRALFENKGYVELEPDFMGFAQPYLAVAACVPKTYRIADIGCYMGAQSYLFADWHSYIGVDNYDRRNRKRDVYVPPARFHGPHNCGWAVADGVTWLGDYLGWPEMDRWFVVVSAVPDESIREWLMGYHGREYRNVLIWYPGEEPYCRGDFADEILGMLCNPHPIAANA